MQLWNVRPRPQIPLQRLSVELLFLITAEALGFKQATSDLFLQAEPRVTAQSVR